jgi:hypothetical protein
MPVSPADNNSDRLIAQLAAGLTPVRRLRSPTVRALTWLAVVAAIALVLASFIDLSALARRLAAAPDMWISALASALTAVLAALAAFHLSVPGRSRAWALAPLPSLLVWILASGAGCLRAWVIPGAHPANMGEAKDCLVFIIGFSVPLSGLLVVMLRRAFPLEPGLTATMAGLAAAAAAATLLVLFHPFDAGATDLAVHAFAVAVVVVALRIIGSRSLQSAPRVT